MRDGKLRLYNRKSKPKPIMQRSLIDTTRSLYGANCFESGNSPSDCMHACTKSAARRCSSAGSLWHTISLPSFSASTVSLSKSDSAEKVKFDNHCRGLFYMHFCGSCANASEKNLAESGNQQKLPSRKDSTLTLLV